MTAASALPVLVPTAAGHGVPLIEALQHRGYTIDHCPFLELRPQNDADTRHALTDLAEGRFAQVVVEGPLSAALLVEALAAPGPGLPEGVRIVSAGFETAEALRAGGVPAHVEKPDAEAPVTQAVGQASAPGEELLLLASSLVPPTLRTALERAGFTVTQVAGYRPRTVSLDPQVVRDLRLHGYSAIALPSTLLASLAGHLGIHRDVRVVTVHHEATGAARAKGLEVHGEAAEPTPASLAAAVDAALRTQA